MEDKTLQRLAERSTDKNIFVFTDFLEEAEQKIAIRMQKFVTLWGGAEFCTRKVARFGNAQELGYEEPFPIVILQIKPVGGKFAKPFTHRDILGAVMNLGVVREKVGDIFAGETSYIVVYDTIAQYIVDNLNKIGREFVQVTVVETLPDDLAPKFVEKQISAESNRLDAIIARLYNLSREVAQSYIQTERVKINGEVCLKAMKPLKENDVVSVRGYGKFMFVGACGESRKGKTYFAIKLFA